jgi:uncharacterized membrane protein (UPF0127 family)
LPWLVRDDEVVASVEIAERRRDRSKGLLGRSGIDGALLLRPARSVHTFGMRFPIDVAFLDRELRVLRMVTVRANRLPRPEWRASAVLEAEAGAFDRWSLRRDDRLVVRGDEGERR